MYTFIDIGAYGRRSDGGIFKESEMGQKFESGEMKLPPPASPYGSDATLPYCIVGDEAFPLKPYLMRPYLGKTRVEHDRRVFNYRLRRARRVIENTFGIMVSRWRIFRKPIIMPVEHSMLIVQAAVCLHNFLRLSDLNDEEDVKYITPGSIDYENENNVLMPGSWRAEPQNGTAFAEITRCGNNSSTKEAYAIREILILIMKEL
ncbi:protein ALP1-like [Anoplophora glabripennis]|uniref:protein ALP1-like n=1 Tax=Anoplophora glabripennis TaxID=217634 RepID=UPI000C774FD8|nr:protein ALP1-like [Anoplophora glabripennis]